MTASAPRRALALATIVAVGWICLTPLSRLVKQIEHRLPEASDAVVHAAMFAALAAAQLRAWPRGTALTLSVALAFAFELGQLRVAGRSFNWFDVAANLAGVAAAARLLRERPGVTPPAAASPPPR